MLGLFGHANLIGVAGDFVGGVLYAVVAFLLITVVVPGLRLATRALGAWGFCVVVELFQLTGIPAVLAAGFSPIALVLGTTFSWLDIVAYAAGVALAANAEGLLVRRRRSKRRA